MLTFPTSDPSALLEKIKTAINEKKIVTWSYDDDGDFTHTPDQWRYRAWLRPYVEQGQLRFGLLGNTKVVTTKTIYAVYHGRFIESVLTHFDTDVDGSAEATALIGYMDAITTR